MSEILYRAVESFDIAGDGRTVSGLAVPFNKRAHIVERLPQGGLIEYEESFMPGAFERAVKAPNRVTFAYGHSESLNERIGYGHMFEQRNAGLWCEFRLDPSKAEQARDVLTSTHRSLSIGFISMKPNFSTPDRGGVLVERSAVHLVHVAAVPEGAYSDALVASVRAAVDLELEEDKQAEEEAAKAEEARLKAEQDELLAGLDEAVAGAEKWKDV